MRSPVPLLFLLATGCCYLGFSAETHVERTLELSCAEAPELDADGAVDDDACAVICRSRAHIDVTAAACEVLARCGGDDTGGVAVIATCEGNVPSECY